MNRHWSGSATPILPVASMDRAAGFYRAIGFEVEIYYHGGYGFVRGGDISIDLTVTQGFDPFVMAGMAYITVEDSDATHARLVSTGLFVDYHSAGETELRSQWSRGEPLSRITEVRDEPWGMREFSFADPDNNLLRVGTQTRP